MTLHLTGSMLEGYRFGLGLALISAQADVIEAEADRDTDDPAFGNGDFNERNVKKERQKLAAVEQLVEQTIANTGRV